MGALSERFDRHRGQGEVDRAPRAPGIEEATAERLERVQAKPAQALPFEDEPGVVPVGQEVPVQASIEIANLLLVDAGAGITDDLVQVDSNNRAQRRLAPYGTARDEC